MNYLFGNWGQKKYKIGFEEMHRAIRSPREYCVIHTMPAGEQDCLVLGTVKAEEEESRIEGILAILGSSSATKIVVYGRNNVDETVEKKYRQLIGLGLTEVYIYVGGMFEWVLLQELYGEDNFPTVGRCKDLLRFKPGILAGF
jgi:rhodanese-related sulfurtransferase